MRLSAPGAPHLTYCTNVHPGERLGDVHAALVGPVARVKRRLSPHAPMGVGLRVSAAAASELRPRRAREALREVLDSLGLYVFTINGFPYGPFHGAPVKEAVYRPDWREDQRAAYTSVLAELLAELLPPGVGGSISTVPAGIRARMRTEGERREAAGAVAAIAAELAAIEHATGKRITLALEPEPGCLLETTVDAVRFFEDALLAGRSPAEEETLRRHVGLCLDACHAAVVFEDAGEAIERLERAGIAIAKVQLSAGLEVTLDAGGTIARELARFDDGVYLHQASVRDGRGRVRAFGDLPDLLAAARRGDLDGGSVARVHVHVPIHRPASPPLRTTQASLARLLDVVRARPVTPHLEVETYTWDVLPPDARGADLVDDVVAELEWVKKRLAAREAA